MGLFLLEPLLAKVCSTIHTAYVRHILRPVVRQWQRPVMLTVAKD